MREILFKAKRIDNGEWVQGYLYIRKDGVAEISYYNKEWDVERYTHEVDANTICQYTGLTDKNGNKIWENDIVLEIQPCKRIFKITYDKDAFCFDGHNIMLRVRNARDKVEVIGNIFDNADLVEE